MGVAFQVLLLVVAIVVAVAGIGVALALRMSARQRARRDRERNRNRARPAAPRAPAPAQVIPLAKARAAAAAEAEAAAAVKPATPLDPEEAHKAKLAALQAMLALGDAKAERNGKGVTFADTQPVDDGYATTQFVDGQTPQVSLLDLDKIPAKRKTPRG